MLDRLRFMLVMALLAGCSTPAVPAPLVPLPAVVEPAAVAEGECPTGTHREGPACIANEAHCEAGTRWDGSACRAAEPEPTSGMPTCTLVALAMPFAQVFVDDKLVGVTPVRAKLIVGVHTASFIDGDNRRSISFECQTGQLHKLAVRLGP